MVLTSRGSSGISPHTSATCRVMAPDWLSMPPVAVYSTGSCWNGKLCFWSLNSSHESVTSSKGTPACANIIRMDSARPRTGR